MTHGQKQVFGGMLSAAALTVIALVAACLLSMDGVVSLRLSAPVASALIALALVFCIADIARKRFFHADVIDGAAHDKPGSAVAIDKAVLQNTLEQTVLAIVAYNGLAAVAPGLGTVLLPALVSLFLLGRVFFIVGYRKGAGGRALGFALTFYPTVTAYVIFVAALILRM